MDFTIPEEYMTSVMVRTEHDFIKDRSNPTPEEIIKILKGYDRSVSISNKDHDEFTKLRNRLEEIGYIKTQRNWWNGDIVLKPFTLNGFKFKKNGRFFCADALKVAFEVSRRLNRDTIY